jgi:hypothetical protein
MYIASKMYFLCLAVCVLLLYIHIYLPGVGEGYTCFAGPELETICGRFFDVVDLAMVHVII